MTHPDREPRLLLAAIDNQMPLPVQRPDAVMKLHRILFAFSLITASGPCVDEARAQATLDWVSSATGRGNAVLTDPNGFIYISTGVFLHKYDLQGNVQWSRMLDSLGGYRDIANWMVFDPSGDIILTGGSSAFGNDFLTMKYDAAGNKLWETFTSIGYEAFRVGTDAAGNSYVVGRTHSSLPDYVTAKYDPNGNEVWTKIYSGGVINRPYALSVSPAGEVAVTGESNTANEYDIATVVYETDGTERWVRTHTSAIAGGGQDQGNCVALGPTGEVYVGGVSENQPFDWDFTLIKYDATGQELWVRDYDSPGPGFDSIDRMALDSQGRIVVVGYMDFDMGIIKYDQDGNVLWMDRFDGGAIGGEEHVSEMIISDDDSIYVTGESAQNILTLKYDANGTLRWSELYNIATTFGEQGFAIGLDSGGGIVVAGTHPAQALRYVEDQTWTGLGDGLAGSGGAPVLTGHGSLSAGGAVTLTMMQSLKPASYAMIIGLSHAGLPFLGGTLVPSPDLVLPVLSTGADGTSVLGANWPAGIPSGTHFYFQAWVFDPAGPLGFAASNGLVGTTN